MFDKKGLIAIPAEAIDEAELMDIVLEAGAEDMSLEEDVFEIITSLEDFEKVKEAVENKGLEPTMAELTMIPQSSVTLDENQSRSMLKVIDRLEDLEDVQKVYTNCDISSEIMEAMAE